MGVANLLVYEKPLFLAGMAAYPYSSKLESRMSIPTKYGEPFPLSRHKNGHLLIPRELAVLPPLEDRRTLGTPVTYPKCDAPPRNAEQERVIQESFALLKKGKSHIIKASTGFGKTYIGTRLAYMLGLKTLVVVTKEDLLSEQQWRGAMRKFAGLSSSDLGLIRQNKCDYKDKKMVLGMVHSLAKEKYPEEIYDEFGLVIFDEVHRMAADTFSIVAGLFNSKLRLGLSAGSSGRAAMRVDNKDFVFESHIGDILVKASFIPMSPKILVLETPWRVPMVPRRIGGQWRTVPLPHEPGKLGGVVVDMAKCMARNVMIVEAVMKAYHAGRHTVVFSELARDKHLNLLYEMAVRAGIPQNDMAFYVGGMKDKEREEAKTKRVVWATYGMTAEATDVPHWDTAVFATPRSNVKQALGRILREHPGKKQPVVFDLVDYDSPILQGYYASRKRLYQSTEISGEVILSHLTKQ